MNKPTINKDVWLQSQVNRLNQMADELNACRKKYGECSSIHVNNDLSVMYKADYDSVSSLMFKLHRQFYETHYEVCRQWEKMRDE